MFTTFVRCLVHKEMGLNADFLTFLGASLLALEAPLIACLYGLDRDSFIFRSIRRGIELLGFIPT